ncbi:MAG TPA: hypothetical protein VNN06_01515, partial [Ramlibacter sp.]|nr:hypothetical protein [Ramlibacter sp.]
VARGVKVSNPALQTMGGGGDFKAETIPLAAVGANQAKVQQMLDRVGFNSARSTRTRRSGQPPKRQESPPSGRAFFRHVDGLQVPSNATNYRGASRPR